MTTDHADLSRALARVDRKLDMVLRLAGLTLHEVEELAGADDVRLAVLAEKLRASGAALAAAADANMPG
jgi:aryl carrier-like protein